MGVESSLHGWTLKNPIYSPNSKKLTFICDYTGVPQVWEFDRAKRRPAHSHFSTKESVTFISYISGTSNLIIGMDASGNENGSIIYVNSRWSIHCSDQFSWSMYINMEEVLQMENG